MKTSFYLLGVLSFLKENLKNEFEYVNDNENVNIMNEMHVHRESARR